MENSSKSWKCIECKRSFTFEKHFLLQHDHSGFKTEADGNIHKIFWRIKNAPNNINSFDSQKNWLLKLWKNKEKKEKRIKSIHFRLTEQENEELTNLAKKKKLSVSSLMKEIIKEELKK